ncbi:hypothetical protein BBM24_17775 [Vibrio parahaemolyticus]|nr:hypothetical protein [Vibrio parahaemolyticus]EHO8535993.1 hypothetical protein [Vibrio parahaemolyticus]EIF2842173.1 hypothetical protein [Vibrio parahaemolyticus]EIJ2228719.1 hypothetical protein [Vibrio parahaemolyticus]ODY32284.1 hypothetical protein BBM22_22050 [Vibrio parahaemolyticus]ODY40403.1 hypothetical protein BBM24_17775 [Vibrio parahaemolyticus]
MLITLERYAKVFSGAMYTFLMAKFLGAESYGYYSYNFALISMIGIFALNGLDGLYQRELSNTQSKATLFFDFFVVKSGVMVIVLGVFFLFHNLIEIELSPLFYFFLPYLLTLPLSILYQGVIYERLVSGLVKVSILNLLLSNSLRVYLFFNYDNVNYFALSYVLEQLIYVIGYFLLYFRSGFNFKLNIKTLDRLKWIWKNGWALAFSAIIVGTFSRVSLFVLEHYESLKVVGQFSLILRVIDALVILAASSSLIKMKELVESKNKDKSTYAKYVKAYKENMYFLSMVSSLLMFLGLYFIVPFFFGEEYQFGLFSCVVASFVVLFNFIGIYTGRVLVVESLYKVALIRNLISLLAVSVLSFIFVPKFGLEGALISLAASWCLSSVLILCLYNKTRYMVI